ncbi:MAG: NADH-quinone oxidoreductase subunit N [Chloroflexi bacterium]|nr:NADH-quinone oxidoreductase subunit N [Chloroflexota bacterium]
MNDISLRDALLILPEIVLAVWASLILTVDLFLEQKKSNHRLMLVLSLVGVLLAMVATLTLAGQNTTAFFGTVVVDNFSVFFKVIFLIAAGLVLLSAESLVERVGENAAEFCGLILFCTAGLMFMASGYELMTIYLALEISSLSLAFLAAWNKRELRSTEAGLKFFVLSAVSSGILLFGMALMYGIAGSTNLADIGRVLTTPSVAPAALLAMSMLVAGFGFKISAVPFQMWTPDVYEGAPTPITAFMSVASKAAGFAVIMRIFDVALGAGAIEAVWRDLFVVLSLVTMTVGNLAALLQTNLKRMLAYSSIGHVGYMLMGLAAAAVPGVAGTAADAPGTIGLSSVLFYLLVYTFTNVGAFAVIIVMSRYVEGEDIGQFAGLARRAPMLAVILTLCLLSLAGLPPLAGFFSKLYLFFAAAQAGLYITVVWGVLNSAISLYYYARVIKSMYLAEPTSDEKVQIQIAPAVSLAAATIGVLVIGLLSEPFIQAASRAAGTIVR